MFGAWNSFVEAATEKAKELVGPLEEGYNEEEKAEEPVIPLDNVAVSPCQQPPEQLQNNAAEWRVLVEGLLQDENTYIISPQRLLEDDAVRTKLEARSLLVLCQEVAYPPAEVPDAFLQGLLASETVQKVRYDIVPKCVIEKHFWPNVYWRIEVIKKCAHLAMMLDLLDILNTEPTERQETRKKNIGSWDNAQFLADLRSQVGQETDNTKWLIEKTDGVTAELRSAGSSRQLLSSLIAKKDTSELGDSVLESCKYHKTKVATLLGELQSSVNVHGTDLNPNGGILYNQLLEENDALQRCVAQFLEIKAINDAAVADPGDCGSSTGVAVGESSGSPTKGAVGGDDDDATFNAEMPWDDDDDI